MAASCEDGGLMRQGTTSCNMIERFGGVAGLNVEDQNLT